MIKRLHQRDHVRGIGRSAAQVTDNGLHEQPAAWEVMDENSLELYPGVPDFPIFEWHSPTDGLIPVDSIDNTLRDTAGPALRWSRS